MADYRIPFNKPSLTGSEFDYIQQALAGGQISGDGIFTKKCQSLLEQILGAPRVFLTTSCTHALEMVALLLDIRPGDEIIVPSFTFVSTINAFVLRGGRPVFIDIRSDTLNLNEDLLEGSITPRTKAIVAVHYAGVGCEMDAIVNVATKRGAAVVEDNAHGLFGKYRGKYLGTFGAFGTQSFHETKNFTCGEGGALVINDRRYIERAEIIREKGTNRTQFFRGQVDKYTWMDVGSSYLPSDILAAFLYAQFESRDEIQRRRQGLWNRYRDALKDWAAALDVRLPIVPEHCEQSFHMFYILLPSLERRQALIAHLKKDGILGVYHYVPLHTSPMGSKFGYSGKDCPVTMDISDRLLRLPFYNDMSVEEQNQVIAAVRRFH